MRVVRVINPRFDALTDVQIADALDQTTQLVRDHFGLEVRFERGEDYDILEIMKLIPPAAEEFAKSQIYPLPRTTQAPNRLAAMIEEYLNFPEVDADLLAEEVAIFIPRAPGMNKSELALAFARIWVSGLRRWHAVTAQDLEPAIDFHNYHQKPLWTYLGYGDLPFDIVITNQLLASAEITSFSPGKALIGGLRLGWISFSRSGRLGAYAGVSTFPLVNDTGDASHLGPAWAADPANDVALILTHELGHMLLRLDHPIANTDCIMSAPRRLEARQAQTWEPVASKCPLESNPQMTPGAMVFQYRRELSANN